MTKTLIVEGMHCEHCAGSVKKHLEKLGGVSASVDLDTKTVTVTMTSDHGDAELTKAVTDAGFEVKSVA